VPPSPNFWQNAACKGSLATAPLQTCHTGGIEIWICDRKSKMTEASKASPQEQAEILMQALPHMLRYDDAIVVVKYGGHAMGGEDVARSFAGDMVLLEQSGVNPVVVHGGGPQIGAMLTKLGIKSEFSNGLRITDRATVEIVEMVLAGSINKQIVGFINAEGGRAIGLCGKDGNMVTAVKVTPPAAMIDGNGHQIDLGFVGEPDKVDTTVLDSVLGRELIPVLAPVAQGKDGETYNVNADTFAGAIAGALKAKRLLFLTDVPGVLDRDKQLIKQLRIDEIHDLIADGTITGGMIPKVETCIYAIEQGVEGVVILDGKLPHAVLIELLTDHGAGTLITR
jgi:acetylglutamate kinase